MVAVALGVAGVGVRVVVVGAVGVGVILGITSLRLVVSIGMCCVCSSGHVLRAFAAVARALHRLQTHRHIHACTHTHTIH